MTNRQWIASFTDHQLSMFMTVGLWVHNIDKNEDLCLSVQSFRTPRRLREWLVQECTYNFNDIKRSTIESWDEEGG